MGINLQLKPFQFLHYYDCVIKAAHSYHMIDNDKFPQAIPFSANKM